MLGSGSYGFPGCRGLGHVLRRPSTLPPKVLLFIVMLVDRQSRMESPPALEHTVAGPGFVFLVS